MQPLGSPSHTPSSAAFAYALPEGMDLPPCFIAVAVEAPMKQFVAVVQKEIIIIKQKRE